MCLTSITATYDNPHSVIIDAWKIFRGTAGVPQFENFSNLGTVKLDQWMTASDKDAPVGIKADDGKVYKPGFHVYADESDRGGNRRRRVYVRQITCVGLQSGVTAMVAQQMYVPSDPDAWPPKESAAAPAKSLLNRMRGKKSGGAI